MDAVTKRFGFTQNSFLRIPLEALELLPLHLQGQKPKQGHLLER
jgi:hypothetical protein